MNPKVAKLWGSLIYRHSLSKSKCHEVYEYTPVDIYRCLVFDS